MFYVYLPNYIRLDTTPNFFETIEEAIEYAKVSTACESHPYLIGTDSEIEAIAFLARVYYPVSVKVVTRC
jgi:hypothetical protein